MSNITISLIILDAILLSLAIHFYSEADIQILSEDYEKAKKPMNNALLFIILLLLNIYITFKTIK